MQTRYFLVFSFLQKTKMKSQLHGKHFNQQGKIFHNKIGELGGFAQLKAFRIACFKINLESFWLPQCKSDTRSLKTNIQRSV